MQLIGRVGVDSSLLVIGDPFYLLDSKHKSVGKSFPDVEKTLKADKNFKTEKTHKLKFNNGIDGLGIVIDTENDGVYPVFLDVNPETNEKSIIIKLFNH